MKILKACLPLLLTFLVGVALAQKTDKPRLTFTKLHNMPYKLLWPATVKDGQYIYAINGYMPYSNSFRPAAGFGYSANVLKYDPANDKWVTFSRKAGYKTQAAASYANDGYTYIFGGLSYSHGQIFQGVQSLNMKTGDVTNLNITNPIAAAYACSAIWDNKIYLFGGTREEHHTVSSLASFDPQTRQFTRLADMPESLQIAGTIVNGILYTFGGYDEFLARQSENINAYDIATNTWRKVGKLPQAVSANSVAASGNLIFVAGNYDDESFLGYFDVTTQKFTQLKSNMIGRRAAGMAIVNNKLYLFGGTSKFYSTVGGIQTVEVADISQLNTYSANK